MMLMALHTVFCYSPPVSIKMIYAIGSNTATNIVESLPGIWRNGGGGLMASS